MKRNELIGWSASVERCLTECRGEHNTNLFIAWHSLEMLKLAACVICNLYWTKREKIEFNKSAQRCAFDSILCVSSDQSNAPRSDIERLSAMDERMSRWIWAQVETAENWRALLHYGLMMNTLRDASGWLLANDATQLQCRCKGDPNSR